MSIQWDEIPHLYGGLLLTRGQSQQYVATYGYYPPVYDLLTAVFFNVFGVSAAPGRLVAVMFSLLSVWIVFEFANRTYGPKIALVASILLGVMPGFFWVSRINMLETMLVFFFSLTLLFFFSWVRFNQNKTLLLCGLALGVGFLA
ncbi:MAG TPA: glycosyltransferase family 39 protein, partial [Candidatus Bathyarchaeia archaeon]